MPHTGTIRDLSASAGRSVSSFGSGPALANVPEAARAEKRNHDRREPRSGSRRRGIGLR